MIWDSLLLKRGFAANRFTLGAGLVAVALLTTAPEAMAASFDNDSGDGLWTTAANWGPDDILPSGEAAEMFLEDQNNALPVVNGFPTVTLNSGSQSPTNIVLGGGSDTDFGDIQFLMTSGTLNLSSDSRIGRGGGDATINNSLALFSQIGGDVIVTGGTGVDIKLGAGGQAYSPAATYSISGGSLNSTGTINFGNNGTTAGPILFEIVGTGPSSVLVGDIKTESAVPGSTALGFVLDAGGVTPLIADDEIQMENLSLELSLSDVPPAGNIVLAQADRLSNDNQFVGLPDGSDVSAPFGLNLYTWTINYFDSSSDDIIIDAIVLSNLRVSQIPEPASLALLALAAPLALLRRRNR